MIPAAGKHQSRALVPSVEYSFAAQAAGYLLLPPAAVIITVFVQL